MLSSMNYYGVCHCLYQYSLFYHVVCDKHHDQNSFTLWVSHSLSPLLEKEIIYVEKTEQSFLKNTCQVLAPLLKTIHNDMKLCLLTLWYIWLLGKLCKLWLQTHSVRRNNMKKNTLHSILKIWYISLCKNKIDRNESIGMPTT